MSFDGLGDFKLGDTDMVDRGVMELEPECKIYISTDEYADRGIYFTLDPNSDAGEKAPLAEIAIRAPEAGGDPVRTEEGAHPGMTYGDIKGLYPEATEESKEGDGGPIQTLLVREGDRELVFLREDYTPTPIEDSQVVQSIIARTYSKELHGSC